MKIRIRLNKVKISKRISRNQFGQPGYGRKTTHTDLKKKVNKERCRKEIESE